MEPTSEPQDEYVAVNCIKCGAPLGWVVATGHTRWAHIECPEYSPVVAVYGEEETSGQEPDEAGS